MIIGKYNKSVILTYVGVTLSIIGIMFTMNQKIDYAMICLIFAGICDLFDGKIAKMCKRTRRGKKLWNSIRFFSRYDIFYSFSYCNRN